MAPDVTGRRARIESLDLIRGAVMVLMAIDHVRAYAGVPAGGPTAGVFFTRWVTHFCAPTFVFLAGTGAFFQGRRLGSRGQLARFLITRGAWLVLLELTVIRFSWTFNFDYANFVLAGVIWMIGCSMILLAALVGLRAPIVGTIGLAIMAGQQLFRVLPHLFPLSMRPAIGLVWEFLYPAGLSAWPRMAILYVIVPWIGVMAAGYGFGAIMLREPADRRRWCLRVGVSATMIFAIVAAVMVWKLPAVAGAPPAVFRALSPSKYPPSQLFLLMTLGPAIALIPWAERARGRFAAMLRTFGRVPLFYYVLHILVIHVVALAVTGLREGHAHPEWYAQAPFTSVPNGHAWSLPLLYAVFIGVIGLLYLPCRWFADVKARHRASWLRYF